MASDPIAERKTPMNANSVQMLFIDHQPEIVGASRTNSPESIGRATIALAKLAKVFEIPVTVSVAPTGAGEPRLIPGLEEALAGEAKFLRRMANAFDDEPTARRILGLGRRDIVICGVVTEVAVLLAAFGARAAGFETHVPADACGGYSQRTEEAAFRRLESFDAATAAVATLGAVLQPDLVSAKGQEMMKILMSAMH